MGFLYTPMPVWLSIASAVAALLLLAFAGWRRPLARLHDSAMQHLWLGMMVAVSVMWAANAWLNDGPVMHLLGATLIVTLFDWRLALFSMAAVCALVAIAFDTPWQGVGMTFMVFGALPVFVSALLQRGIAAWLPRNLFVFIVGHGFFTAALAMLAACGASLLVHVALNAGSFAFIPTGYVVSVALLASGEAWFCGMLTMLFAIYRPAWVTTCDVRRYRLDRGPRT
jgi:uncharacterized membrane protein